MKKILNRAKNNIIYDGEIGIVNYRDFTEKMSELRAGKIFSPKYKKGELRKAPSEIVEIPIKYECILDGLTHKVTLFNSCGVDKEIFICGLNYWVKVHNGKPIKVTSEFLLKYF